MNLNNPLFSEQRENDGAATLAKYFYQYHWALDEALEKLRDEQKYIVFMETHEDVVFADSLNESANFNFFQIKETKKQTIKSLCKREDKKNSILGKCLLSVHNKIYEKQVQSICVLVSNGFSFKSNLLRENLQLEIIGINDFNQDTVDELSRNLGYEISANVDIAKLTFCSSKLSTDFEYSQYQLIGKIEELMNKLFPNAHYRAKYVYTSVIDDLLRKGTLRNDYRDWQVFVSKKGLKSDELLKVLHTNTNINFNDIRDSFNDIAEDLEIKGYRKTKFRQQLETLHAEIYNMQGSRFLSLLNQINDKFTLVAFSLDNMNGETISTIKELMSEFDTDINMDVIIVYAIIRRILDENTV